MSLGLEQIRKSRYQPKQKTEKPKKAVAPWSAKQLEKSLQRSHIQPEAAVEEPEAWSAFENPQCFGVGDLKSRFLEQVNRLSDCEREALRLRDRLATALRAGASHLFGRS